MNAKEMISKIIESRKPLLEDIAHPHRFETEAEGGCGVTGFACSIPVRGKHIFEPSRQMHNRGNGRGGGIAAMGFDPRMLGVSPEILEDDYILQIAVLEKAEALGQHCLSGAVVNPRRPVAPGSRQRLARTPRWWARA